MKLSEAMRLGSMLHPQAHGGMQAVMRIQPFGSFLGLKPVELVVGTCALGAAIEAAGVRQVGPDYVAPATTSAARQSQPGGPRYVVPLEWDAMLRVEQRCSDCGLTRPLLQLIAHLNDDHRWDREKIAGFVEAIEAVNTSTEPATVEESL